MNIFNIRDKTRYETDRLTIRRFRRADWKDLHEYLSDKEVVRYEPYGVHSEWESKREAARRATDDRFWAVCLKGTGKLIGNVYFAKRDYDARELGYAFNRAYHGNGYATEACRKFLSLAFENWGVHRVYAQCNPDNTASWRLLERLGMQREAHLRKNVFFKRDGRGNPIWWDTYEYSQLGAGHITRG